MNSIYDAMKHRMDEITKLRDVLKKMDPLSGLTVHIRRGVAHDNPDVDDDHERRPWIHCELSGSSGTDPLRLIINTLIQEQTESLKFLNMMATDELKSAQKTMAAVGDFLSKETK